MEYYVQAEDHEATNLEDVVAAEPDTFTQAHLNRAEQAFLY